LIKLNPIASGESPEKGIFLRSNTVTPDLMERSPAKSG